MENKESIKKAEESAHAFKQFSVQLKEIHTNVPPDYYDNTRLIIQRYWHQKRFEVIKSMLKNSTGLILDIGCNGGTFTNIIKKATSNSTIIGIDIHKEAVKYAAKKYDDISFLVGDGQSLPFRNDLFDLITCLEVLEHMPQPDRSLKEINRCLKVGRNAILLIPDVKNFLFKIIWYLWLKTLGKIWRGAHIQELDEKQIEALINNAQLRLVKKRKSHLGMLTIMKISKP
ncbi:MAG: methyltransferase domain-containing protein [Nitrososphaerota archaeon]